MIKKLSFKLFCLLFLGREAFTIEINKKGIAKLSIPEKIKSEIINELNMINVTKQHNYYFQKG